MPNRKGIRVYRPFAVECDIKKGKNIERQTVVYRATSVENVKRRTDIRLAIVNVIRIREITEDEYDVLMKSRRYPKGLPPESP